VGIATCSTPGTIAITFDDGPFIYTTELLDVLAQNNAKATFFVNGNNWGDASQAPYPDVLRRIVSDGHQLGSHTWSHQNLDEITSSQRLEQMVLLENLLKGIFGYVPTYMRPPYGACGSACQADLANLGYHVIMWNIDTLDYNNNSPTAIQTSKNIFDNAVSSNAGGNSYISLAHDVHQYTVQSLAAHIIQTAHNRGYRTVTVGECLGDPSGNWYRDGTTGEAVGGGNGGGLAVSPDGTCASNSGGLYTCQGSSSGNCCSEWGWW
jgi:peptidoglycan/xylan/chitin deacetylase (PgdA/CDA1 family)